MDWVALVVGGVTGVAGTALGTRIGLVSARNISREERAEAAHDETVRAFGVYFGTLAAVVGLLRGVPPVPDSTPVIDALGGLLNRVRGDAATYITTQKHLQEMFGDHQRELSTRLATVTVDLLLRDLPPDVRAAVDAANDYVERLSEQRSHEIIAEWSEIHARLTAANAELRAARVITDDRPLRQWWRRAKPGATPGATEHPETAANAGHAEGERAPKTLAAADSRNPGT